MAEINNRRMRSLDLFRGAIMFFLLLETVFFIENLEHLSSGGAGPILRQFFHVPWSGLSFWDLIQPGFMFIAGTAMYLSLLKRNAEGTSKGLWIRHILIRSVLLLCFGVGLHWMYSGEPVFEFAERA